MLELSRANFLSVAFDNLSVWKELHAVTRGEYDRIALSTLDPLSSAISRWNISLFLYHYVNIDRQGTGFEENKSPR